MRTVLVIDTDTGDDIELEHEDIQTIRDCLARERERTDKAATMIVVSDAEAIDVKREKLRTWRDMLTRVLTKLA